MFTGIIEEVGSVKSILSSGLELNAKKILKDVHLGDSIAVNGVCLTVTSFTKCSFTVDVMPETFRRSSLACLSIGSRVNLERAMAANGRFGGHIVAGHVDDTGSISKIKKEGNAILFTIKASPKLLRYIVEKGSITIDGISLTVAGVSKQDFFVSIIPHTGKETTLLERKVGDIVNLENDIIGKYVEKLLFSQENFQEKQTEKKESKLTMDFLSKHGF